MSAEGTKQDSANHTETTSHRLELAGGLVVVSDCRHWRLFENSGPGALLKGPRIGSKVKLETASIMNNKLVY